MSDSTMDYLFDAIIVGGGAAGVGVAVALQHAGIGNFLLLERHEIGASFAAWPAETRFITPSFATNSVGMLDLNSIAIGTSPAFSLEVEHPTGKQYAAFLKSIAVHFELPVAQHTDVQRITHRGNDFVVETSEGTVRSRNIIWAAGDYLYPKLDGFVGSTLCRHTATIPSYAELEGDDFIVIGGYESGIDVAYHLAERGKSVRLFDRGHPWASESSDPSVALSTYSLERTRRPSFAEHVKLFADMPIAAVTHSDSEYEVVTLDGRGFQTPAPPLLAGGFKGVIPSSPIFSNPATTASRSSTSATNPPLPLECSSAVQPFGTTTSSSVSSTSIDSDLRSSPRRSQPRWDYRRRGWKTTVCGACTWMTFPAAERSASHADRRWGRSGLGGDS